MLCKVFWSNCSNFFKFDFDQDLWLRILFWFLQARIRFIFDQKATIISIRQCPIELIRKLYCMQWYRFFFSTDPPRNRRNFFAYIRTQNRRIRLKYNYFLSHEYLNDTLNVLIINLFTPGLPGVCIPSGRSALWRWSGFPSRQKWWFLVE